MPPNPNANRDTKWADGLRGLASLLVVTAHVCRSLTPVLLYPAISDGGPPTIMQLPFIRCLTMGRASVAVFAILSGYVNALKPIKQTRAGNIEAALVGIAKSAFRRTGRFVIPAVVATSLSWLVCQFGAYRLAKQVDSNWIRDTSPTPSASFAGALKDLIQNIITTWTNGANAYDRIQWTLCYLLRGSMLVYLTMFATAYVKPTYRLGVYAILYMYYWKIGDAVIGINVYAGLFLAEVSLDPMIQDFAASRRYIISVLSTLCIIAGLYCNSYPEEKAEWAQWSRHMIKFGGYIFPKNSEFARFYPGVGSDLLCLGIMFNATAKKILSHSYLCWLGKMSFAIYLLHAPLIRTLLTVMLYGVKSRPNSPGKNAEGHDIPRPWIPHVNNAAVFILVPLFYVLLYRIAAYWQVYVDPWCGRATNWLEEMMYRDDAKAEKPLLS
ncbi:hypothetical protein MMC25_002461 [Agyrium rufum]|nr:hypothetical protein [Agyrium rufum]